MTSASAPQTPLSRSRFNSWKGGLSLPMPSSNYARSHASSRPQSASFYRAALVEVHTALYGRGDREEVLDCLQRCYDSDAVFENPFTMVTGRDGIANHFSLMTLLPGELYDELGEISESEDYDGSRTILFSHTMHVALLPSLAEYTLPYSTSFASFPNTPYTQTPSESPRASHSHLPRFTASAAASTTGPPDNRPQPSANGDAPAWPIMAALSLLNPRTVLANMTTVHLRVLTTLKFNEAGRIVHHEDTWGIKEVVEGFVPIAGRLYWLQRKAIGTAASTLAKALGLSRPLPPDDPAEEKDREGGLSMRTPPTSNSGGGVGAAQGLGLMDMQPAVTSGPPPFNGHL